MAQMTKPICKIAQENGGEVPIECLFDCPRDCHRKGPIESTIAPPLCNRCGNAIELVHSGVRWRPYEPGALRLHRCNPPVDPSEFQPIKD